MTNNKGYLVAVILTFVILGCCSTTVLGQLTATKNIPGDYSTIRMAVTALNTSGVGVGGVTFNIAAGYTETLDSTIYVTATGTAANPIVFQKNPASTGSNPLITAYTGGTYTPSTVVQDGVWRLSGSDYITIDGIDVRDNPANTTNPSTMEYGYALYLAGSSNGCQYVTIKNCTITLSNINNASPANPMTEGSAGIIVMNATATSANVVVSPVAGGANSNNRFYSNLIQNCNIGISVIGFTVAIPYTLGDTNNDIGGSSAETGNTIINFGGASGAVNAAAGIRTLNQYNLKVSYNTINSNNGSGSNHPVAIRGIYINSAPGASATVTYNTVTVKGSGSTQNIVGIENGAGATAAGNTINISNNIITNSTYNTATTGGFYGIYNNVASPATLIISSNTISGNSFAASTSGFFYGILNSGVASTVAMNSNSVTGNTASPLSTGSFSGIANSAATPVLNINSNTLADNSTASGTAFYYAISNSASVTTTLNINANRIGTSTLPAVNFTVPNSGTHLLINNTRGTVNAALSISNNNFYNVLYSTQGIGSVTLISNSASTASLALNNNVFTNLNVNTTGSLTFMSVSAVVGSTGTQNVNNNSISGTFTKAPGGIITLFTSTATSALGGIVTNNNNNFSNITVSGGTTIAGWVNTDAGFATKTIQNNIFSNWVAGTSPVSAMNINISGAVNATTGNLINNISSGGTVAGISTASGNDKIFLNTINSLSSTSTGAVTGILVTAGTVKDIYNNKIYDLQSNNAGGSVSGITVSGSTLVTANIYNNLIGDLRTPVANTSNDVLRGISITATATNSTINIYNNTIHLNGTSTGTIFSSTGIFHAANATSTTAVLNLRNNIISNTSTPNGTGMTVAFRRSGPAFNNYASTSNNNLFYAGPLAANRLILYNVTYSDQTLSIYKTRVTASDAQSVTEDLSTVFLSTSGASASFLHLSTAKPTQAESGGVNIASVTTDVDGAIRQGNAGYAGTGTAPDIGADEFEGIKATSMAGTYKVGAGEAFTSLTNAGGLFAGVNSLGLGGDVIVKITSDLTEDGSNGLYPWVEQGIGNYTLTIQADAAVMRTVTGNVTTGMIRLTGVKRAIIDGSNTASPGNFLTFRNNGGATSPAFIFINGASNNTINNCNIEAYGNATNGTVLFSSSTVPGGNSNNLISNCNINATIGANTGSVCIYSLGTAGSENATNTLSGNKIFNFRDRGIEIPANGTKGWIITGNSFYNGDISGTISYAPGSTVYGMRILGGTGYLISKNYIGGSAALASGAAASYASAGIVAFQGISLTNTVATPGSAITGNTITNIAISAVPLSATSAYVFVGIETYGQEVNIGGSLPGDGNIIGSNTSNGSILITTTTSVATYVSAIRGISCLSKGGTVTGNQVGGIDINNLGTAADVAGPTTFYGIIVANAAAPSLVNNNIVGSYGAGAASNSIRVLSTSASTKTILYPINIASSVLSAVQVDGNVVQNLAFLSTATTINGGGIYGISSNASSPAAISITNNIISSSFFATYTNATFCGIYTSGTPATLSINNNTLAGNSNAAATGGYSAIYNAATTSGAVTINSNNIGTSVANAFTCTVANSGTINFITNGAGTATTAVSISNNNFQGINYAVPGTGSPFCILNSAATTLSQTINGNTFTNLNVNTTGNFTFISNNVVVPANGTQNVNNNSIITGFTKKTGNTVTLFNSAVNSVNGAIINNNNNNFSNITVTGATTIAGWVNTDGGTSTKNIQNNTFSNWSGGTNTTTVLSVSLAGTNNVSGNLINSITGGGAVTGISTNTGNNNIYSNIINTLSSTGASTVAGIAVIGGTNQKIYKNKIYDLLSGNSGGSVYAISVSGSTVLTVNIFNNIIGDLKTPVSNQPDAIRGISINTTVVNSTTNVYYNTIYLNASSTNSPFGTSGIYHAANGTATTSTLNLRNNSITNLSTPNGSGLTVAFRRSAAALNNYASTSNNNLFYAGTSSATRVIYYDNVTPYLGLAAFKSQVSTRDAQSVTENLSTKFLSTTGSSSLYLHMSSGQPTAIESGAVNIAGYTDDFDTQIRSGNSGYIGASTSPDIGADEVFGIEIVPPTITYTPLSDVISRTNRLVTGITITDASGINNNAGTNPRIYYKRYTDANVWIDNTSNTNGWKYAEATNAVSPYTFTIDYALLYGGAAVTAGIIQYFIVAQDLATVANVAMNSGTLNTTPVSVALSAATFPVTGTINSYKVPFSGTYNVGSTEVFTSLTKANGLFASINSVGLIGNSTFTITSDLTEDGTNALDQWVESGSGNYSLTFQPDAAVVRTISGNVATGLIRLNGTDRVTIDGSNGGGGSYLRFKNTNAAGTTATALTFQNGATNDKIRYAYFEAYSNVTNGVVLFSTGGNSNNLVDNCTVNATVSSNTGKVAVYASGSAANENIADTISNNSIYDYSDHGLHITATASSGWVISGNSFYNGNVSGTINYPAASALNGILIQGGSGYRIVNNYIGGSNAQASGNNAVYSSSSGALSYQAVVLAATNALPASYIQGNTISAITVSALPSTPNAPIFTGIFTSGPGINVGGSNPEAGNIIGSGSASGNIIVTTATSSPLNTSRISGIYTTGNGGVINNNQVGGFNMSNIGAAPAPSLFTGIYANNSTGPTQINGNLIGSRTASGNIRFLPGSTAPASSLTGIQIGTAVSTPVEIIGNRIENLSNLSTTASGDFTGISNTAVSGGAVMTISTDTVQNINTAANSNAESRIYTGIFSSSPSSITNNILSNITLASTGVNAQVTGVQVSGAFAYTVSGNVIANLSTASNKAIAIVETQSPAGAAIIGVLNSATGPGQIISNNRFSGFSATSNAGFNVVVTGLGITANSTGNIFNNKFGTMTNLATGAAPAIVHIVALNGSYNVYNNTSRISNLTNTTGIKLYGIVQVSPNYWNYFHNSIRVGGYSTGTAVRSAAILLSGNSPAVLKNNIFFNVRTGTGTHYAVSNLSSPPSWSASTSDYNDFYSINPGTVAEWGSATSKSFPEWQSLSGGDVHSINNAISFINSTYDLEPDSVSNCNFNGVGIPITTPVVINTDINNNPRSAVAPDLGAYEFRYTGFTIITGSNSPVCAGDNLLLTVNSPTAISPHFSWRNPANAVISTLQNPALPLVAGQYKITVTDSTGCFVTDSTLVLVNQRPTATISAQTSVCDSAIVYLRMAVTGTGIITGTLSNGDAFSGTAPLIIDTVFVTTTTSFSITSLSDGSCTSVARDFPDTLTVTVTHKGDWLGITSNWNDPVNWCGGIIPTSSVDVIIPAGTSIMPVITGNAYCKQLTVEPGDTLTVSGTGTLNIAGMLKNNGIYTDNGTTYFNGTTGQQNFSGVTVFNNLIVGNTSSLLLPASISVKRNLTISQGNLIATGFTISLTGNWTNNASVSAFTAGTGTVTFSGTTAQTIGGSFATTFNHLTISNTVSTVSLLVNAGITGNLSVSSGTFDLAGFTANRTSIGGTLTVANNTTLKIGGTNTFPINYLVNTLLLASTVEYSGTNQTIAKQPYGNLILSSSAGPAVKTGPATALTIVGNLTMTIGAGTSVVLNAAANITTNGNVSIGASTTFDGSSYSHSVGGNWVNSGTFTGNTSTITLTGAGTSVSGSGVQNFNNLIVAAYGISFPNTSVTVSGDLATTGSGAFVQAVGGTLVMSGTGKTISGSGISLHNLTVSGTVTTATSFIVFGNLAVSGNLTASAGTVTLSGASKTVSGAGVIGFSILLVTGTVTSGVDFTIANGLSVIGSFTATAGTATFKNTSSLSGIANLYNVIINGTSLQLSTGAVLGIANILNITSGVLDVTSSGNNTVNFNGTGPQNVNGITYSNLLLSNGYTKTAAGPISTANDITIATGTSFNPSSYTHSIFGNWINNGTFIAASSTIQFVGPATAYITGATTFNILTSNTSSASTELLLQSNVSAAIVNMTNGMLLTGVNTLTITNTRTGNGFIQGNILRTHAFIPGVAYAFEGPQNTVTFSAVSGVSSVLVSVAEASISDFPFGGSIGRVYTINVPVGTYNATLRLHYEDDELNGNNETSMSMWKYSGTSWASIGKSDNNTTSNYVEQTGLTNISSRWTISDNGNIVQWNGSVSSDWNTAGNWTVLQGAASRPPAAADIVNLGTAAFTYQPTITSNVTVKNIAFGSAQAVKLTLGNGGALTTLGAINGSWTGNAIHSIFVNGQSLIVTGNIDLSDGINGHAIDLNIGTGTVTILASLVQSGGASINFSGAGTLNIHENFNYINGTFVAGSGTVIYNGDENQHVAHLNYNHLIIDKTAGLAAIDSTTNIAGNLSVSAGVLENYATTTITGNVTINPAGTFHNFKILHVQGDWNNNGIYVPQGASIYFDGSGNQTISASTFNNLNINKPSGTATLTGEITVTGNFKLTSGIFDFQSYFVTRDVIGGNATIGPGAIAIIGGNNGPANFATKTIDLTSTVIYNGVNAQYISSDGIDFGNVIFRNGGSNAKLLITPASIKGNLTIESGATLNAAALTISLGGNWINQGLFVPAAGTVLLNGLVKTITGTTTFNYVTVSGSYTLLNDVTFKNLLTITNIGSFYGGSNIQVILEKDLINSGILYTLGTTTFKGNVLQTLSLINAIQTVAVTVNFNGTVSPVLNSTSPPEYGYLNINNTGGVFPSVGWKIQYALNVGPGASFNGGASTHTIYGSVTNNGTITSSGSLVFMPATATTVNLGNSFSSTGRVYFAGTGAMTVAGTGLIFNNVNINNTNSAGITPPTGWNIGKDLTVATGSLMNAGAYTYQLGGNLLNRGTINSGSSTFLLNGASSQNIETLSAFNNLTLNKTTGSAVLLSNARVNGALNFIKGTIQTGSYTLSQPVSGTVTGASKTTGWVDGKLQKYVPAGATTKSFEVGSSSGYAPVSLVFGSVSTAGDLTVSSTAGDHPNLNSSPVNTSKSVNRFWTLLNSGITFTTYTASYYFVAADLDAGTNTTALSLARYNGSTWALPVTASRTDTSIQATGVDAFGDFSAGEICSAGTTISYPGSPFCTSAGTATPARTGTSGGTYTATSGLTIDAATGVVTLASSIAGTYKITYTVAATGECSGYATTANITITIQPFANEYYDGNPYCINGGTAAPTGTQVGVPGTLTSTAGLSINSATGVVNLGASIPGTYAITYTVQPFGGCGLYTNATSIVIKPIPSATISYAGSSYCVNAGIVSVTQTGTTTGTYSSTSGLVIDSLTGFINTTTSIAGIYTVTYRIAASGCDAFTTTTGVLITAVPFADISYSGSPFCQGAGTALVTHSGTDGGAYSSTPGLMIDPATGNIDLGGSTPGTYTITYFMAAANGCSAVYATTSVTVTVSPSATINYAGSPYINAGTATVTRTGTPGGVYTSTAGLVIDAASGSVDLTQSALGIYTVTYAIAASGGCAVFETTAAIRIYSSPVVNLGHAPNIGTAVNFVLFTVSGAVSNTGVSQISGNIGTNVGGITGFGISPVSCARHTADAITVQAAADVMAAYHQLDTTSSVAHGPLFGNGETIYAGVYSIATAGSAASVLNLDAQGNADAIFIFKIGGAFTTSTATTINLVNGASSCNVFWVADGAIALGISTNMKGTLIANGVISMADGGTLDGRMLSIAGAVSVDRVTASVPSCATLATSWTGAVSSTWNNACNWAYGTIPTTTTNVSVPSGILNYPRLDSGTGSVGNLTMQNGATLKVANAFLRISGIITNSGLVIADSGTIEMNGSVEQTIPTKTFAADQVQSFTVNNAAGVVLGGPLSVANVLSIASGSLVSNGYLTLKSTATGTARVARITSNAVNPILGNVTVERYIPGRRKYRLITSSVTTHTSSALTAGQESLSIWGNWQNKGNNDSAHSGTLITGGTLAQGFDPQTPNASLFTYDDVNRKFVGYTTANGKNTRYTPLKAGIAYYMFVYGDRTNTITTSFPNNTVIRSTGTLLTGDQAYTTTSTIPLTNVTGRFTLLGNPFASPINWATIPKTNLENACWGWDPNIGSTGGYVTVLTNGSVVLQAPYSGSAGLNQYIQPGQGFFVRTAGPSPTLTIREQDKVTNFNGNAFRINGADTISLIAVNLYYANGATNVLADGVLAAFNPAFSNKAGTEDAVKLANSAESMALVNDTSAMSIDARRLPANNDTLFLNVSRLTKPQYTLQIFTEDLAGRGLAVFLQDRYLNTLQPLSLADTNNILINVNTGIAASADINRFRLVFRSSGGALPVTYTSIKASRKSNDVQVAWEIATESGIQKYEIERSGDGVHFIKRGDVNAVGNTAVASYQWLDTDPLPANNYYRVRAVQADGQYFLSSVVLVTMTAEPVTAAPLLVTVFPNPVKNQQITMRSAAMEKGEYTLRLLNAAGQQVITRVFGHAGGRFEEVIYFNKVLPAGMYYLQLQSEKGRYQQLLFVE